MGYVSHKAAAHPLYGREGNRHAVERGGQLGHLVLALDRDADAEIALPKSTGGRRHLTQRADHTVGQGVQHDEGQGEDPERGEEKYL